MVYLYTKLNALIKKILIKCANKYNLYVVLLNIYFTNRERRNNAKTNTGETNSSPPIVKI